MRAVILLSGGIDSTVVLAWALAQKRHCYALSFDYGQRHRVELKSAQAVATYYGVHHKEIRLPSWGSDTSPLLSETAILPLDRDPSTIKEIAPTYVPARNTLFLAYALGYAEIVDAAEIYIGANADDRMGYPDCRPSFFEAFQQLALLATKQGVTVGEPRLCTPLLHKNKREIVALGNELAAPLAMTFSCYAPTESGSPCHRCDACMLRERNVK